MANDYNYKEELHDANLHVDDAVSTSATYTVEFSESSGDHSMSQTSSSEDDLNSFDYLSMVLEDIKMELSKIYVGICIIGGTIAMAIIVGAAIIAF